jgi:galactonate dehydratase
MKIINLSTFIVHVNHRGNWVFVEVETDAGIVGTGEASHSGNDALCVAALKQMGESLIGADPRRVNAHWQHLARAASGRVQRTALSAMEMALWDIVGQVANVPVHQLFGGAVREKIPLYANVNRGAQDRSPEHFAQRARAAVAEGFKAVKVAPFDEVHHARMDAGNLRRAAEKGLERVAAVREAVGEGVDVLVDCHCRFDVATARQVAVELAALNVFWFEEPVSRHPVALLREVKDSVNLPIAAGEEFFGCEEFYELLTMRACHYAMPDVKHCGGIAEGRRIAALAETVGVAVSPHNPAGPVSTAASVHLCAVLPNFLMLEYQWGEVDWRCDLMIPPETVVDGCLALPDAAGLGVRLNREVLDALTTPQSVPVPAG